MVELQQPVAVPMLSRSAHDRVAHRRVDAQWLEAAWNSPSSLVLVLSAAAEARSASSNRLELLNPAEVDVDGDRILLGEAEGRVYFAVLAYTEAGTTSLPGAWRGLRELAVHLGDLDIGLLTTAVALQQWHQRHTHCPRCGTVTEPAQAGWTRVCPHDGSEHFPRTDPAVIMLITDEQDRCLLARSPLWPEGRMSVLAGFVEAGESAEAAVAREVGEEVGISVGSIRYFASQPHPFPSSLMLGYTAQATGNPTLHPDDDEIADAGWFTRDEVRVARDWGQEGGDVGGERGGEEGSEARGMLRALPPTMSIARQLIDAWIASA